MNLDRRELIIPAVFLIVAIATIAVSSKQKPVVNQKPVENSSTSSVSNPSATTTVATTTKNEVPQNTIDPFMKRYEDVEFGRVSSTDPNLINTLLMEAYNQGDIYASPKFEDPLHKGSFVFRISVPYYSGRPDTAECGMYGTPLCSLVYQAPGQPLRIIPNTSDSENNILDFVPEGILASNSGGDAGAFGTSYDLINPVTGDRKIIASIGGDTNPLTGDTSYSLSAGEGKVSFTIADFSATGTKPEVMEIRDGDRLLKRVIPLSTEGAYEVSILIDETLHHPGKIYFTIGYMTFIFDGTVKPAKLIQL